MVGRSRDFAVLGMIVLLWVISLLLAYTNNSTVFWYGQIVVQIVIAAAALALAFRGVGE